MIEVLARQLQQIKQTDLIVNIFSFSRFDYYKSVKLVENNILSARFNNFNSNNHSQRSFNTTERIL